MIKFFEFLISWHIGERANKKDSSKTQLSPKTGVPQPLCIPTIFSFELFFLIYFRETNQRKEMSSTVLEVIRLNQELSERLELAFGEELDKNASGVSLPICLLPFVINFLEISNDTKFCNSIDLNLLGTG